MSEFHLKKDDFFGRYCKIETGDKGEDHLHIYKIVGAFASNTYSDVPITYQTETNPYIHNNVIPVLNVIHCGLNETNVIRVAQRDVWEIIPKEELNRSRVVPFNNKGVSCCEECGKVLLDVYRYCPDCGRKLIYIGQNPEAFNDIDILWPKEKPMIS